MKELSSSALRERFDRGEVITLLDVRQPEERAFCAIGVPPTSGDLFVPMSEVPARLEEIRIGRAQGPVVVYCHHGVRSLTVVEWLAKQGIAEVYNLWGGIDAYSRNVDSTIPRY